MRIKSAYKENLGDVDMSKCQSKGPYYEGPDGSKKFRIRFYIDGVQIEWEYPSKKARDKELAAIEKLCGVIDLGEEAYEMEKSVAPWNCPDCGFSVPVGYDNCPFCVCKNEKCSYWSVEAKKRCKHQDIVLHECTKAIRGKLETKSNL